MILDSSVDDAIPRQLSDQINILLWRTGTKIELWRSRKNGHLSRKRSFEGDWQRDTE